MHRFHQPIWPGGPVQQPYSFSVLSPILCFKNTATGCTCRDVFYTEKIMQENWQGKDLSCLSVKVKYRRQKLMEALAVLEGGSLLSPANLFTCIGSIYM